uniref:Uncharacterized protein n=1 Tax=Mustela putorius furo TaxID=9669 RepID=M3Z1I0_MUSPF
MPGSKWKGIQRLSPWLPDVEAAVLTSQGISCSIFLLVMDCLERRRARSAGEGALFIETGLSGKPPDTLTSEQRPERCAREAMSLSLGRESQAKGTASTKALGLQPAW